MGICKRLCYATDDALGLGLINVESRLSSVARISRPDNVAIDGIGEISVWVIKATEAASDRLYTICFIGRCSHRLTTRSTVDRGALAATQIREIGFYQNSRAV